MTLIERATVIHYHRYRIEHFDAGTPESLGWRGDASQLRRFEILSGLGDFSGHSILDAGCGYGDLKAYLDQRCPGFNYLGVDQMPEFIEEAKEGGPMRRMSTSSCRISLPCPFLRQITSLRVALLVIVAPIRAFTSR
jgi:2-polyprenyl-3-methyl-5-hydroxy-6-metoxy-1,4-benzoquinol methylase